MKRGWKKSIFFLIFIVSVSIFRCPVGATNSDRTIRIGYIDYGSFIEKDQDGTYHGYGVEYLEKISEYTGWKYEYVYDTWENCLKKLEQGEIDFVGTAQKTPEREKQYDFADISNGVEQTIIYTTMDNQDIYYNDYAAFNGKRVGLLVNSFQTEYFQKYAN